MTTKYETGFEKLKAAMIADYKRFKFSEEMLERYAAGIQLLKGRKYLKVVTDYYPEELRGSAYAFIVVGDDDKKFQDGDILKPAGWATPARNFARGNLLKDEKFEVSAFGL